MVFGQIRVDVGDLTDILASVKMPSAARRSIHSGHDNRYPSLVCREIRPFERSVSEPNTEAPVEQKFPRDGDLLPLAEAVGRDEGEGGVSNLVVHRGLH